MGKNTVDFNNDARKFIALPSIIAYKLISILQYLSKLKKSKHSLLISNDPCTVMDDAFATFTWNCLYFPAKKF